MRKLWLDAAGGNVEEAIAIGRWLRDNRFFVSASS
jgi:hypothetical protein